MFKLRNNVAIERIRKMQRDEGSVPCFRTDKLDCMFTSSCCWSEICLGTTVPVAHVFKVVPKEKEAI